MTLYNQSTINYLLLMGSNFADDMGAQDWLLLTWKQSRNEW